MSKQNDELVNDLTMKLMDGVNDNRKSINDLEIKNITVIAAIETKIQPIPDMKNDIKKLNEKKQDKIKLLEMLKNHFWKTFFSFLLVLGGSIFSLFKDSILVWIK